jgi:hypothetical protein
MVAATMGDVDFACMSNQVACNVSSSTAEPGYHYHLAEERFRAVIVGQYGLHCGIPGSVLTA